MTTKRTLLAIIFVPFTILLIAFIIANRQMVVLTVDPFRTGSESLTYQAPLFIWLFIFFGLGILLSGIIHWFTCHKCRKNLKESKAELEKLKKSISNII
ncbi:LapA family protein [Bartonella sp. CB175]|uniref:LapA family protein n=1 Tax=Bartonella sp. CB175 TaxID=3112256 RepID=UPI00300E6B91